MGQSQVSRSHIVHSQRTDHVDIVEIAQKADDLAGGQPAGVHRDNLVVEPWEAALVLGDQQRVKARLAEFPVADRAQENDGPY
jgi:hypothetical protein